MTGRRILPHPDTYMDSDPPVPGRLYQTNAAGKLVPVIGDAGELDGAIPDGYVVTRDETTGLWVAKASAGGPGGGGGSGPSLLQTVTASASATLDATAWADATLYERYTIELDEIVLSGTNNLWLRFSTDSGATYDASAIYVYGLLSYHAGGTGVAGAASGATKIALAYDASSDGLTTSGGWGFSAVLDLMHAGSTTSYKQILGQTRSKDSLGPTRNSITIGATYESLTAVNGLRILPSGSNTITSGRLKIWGWPKIGGGSGGGAAQKYSLAFPFTAAGQAWELPMGRFASTIKAWACRLNVSGSATFSVQSAPSITGSYVDMIGAGAGPAVSSALGVLDTDITDWSDTALNADEVIKVTCTALTTATQATLTLHFERVL